jgi:hypothetical protein
VSLTISVEVDGTAQFAQEMQRFRNALADRRPLHAQMAVAAGDFTRDYLRSDSRHATAQRLGGKPTGFRAKNAAAVEAFSDESAASIRIPRSTGLGRAFGELVIRHGSGKTYLTIPAHQETYGKSVRDFPADSFHFAVLTSIITSPCLMWSKDGGAHKAGEVAYWLRREVKQTQDRTLLPSDAAYTEVGRRAAVAYIAHHIYHAP